MNSMKQMKRWYLLNSKMQCISFLDPTLPRGFGYEEDMLTEKLSFASKSLEFKLPLSHPSTHKVTESSFILIPRKHQAELFAVVETEEEGNCYKRVWCEPLSIVELGGRILRPMQLKSVPFHQAMNLVLSGSGWSLGKKEGSGIRDLSFSEPITVLEAIHEIANAYQVEIEFKVEMQGFVIQKRRVNAYLQRGKHVSKPIALDDKQVELKKTIDRKNIITALIGLGPQREDGSFLTFQDYIPPPRKGVEKQEDWVGDLHGKEKYGKGKHLFGVHRDEHAQNAVELYNNTVRELKRRSKPQTSYTLQLSSLPIETGGLSIGDTFYMQTRMERKAILMRVVEQRRSNTNMQLNCFVAEQV